VPSRSTPDPSCVNGVLEQERALRSKAIKTMRTSHPCDGCALRRVRCTGGQPCRECEHRSISCTFLRVRRKRGPKGPRPGTNLKIEEFQRKLKESATQQSLPSPPEDTRSLPPSDSPSSVSAPGFPLKVYERFLRIFRQRLYTVWPLVSYDDLISRLTNNRDDHESYSLAAALCSAVIAQLRLPEHVVSFDAVSSSELAAESIRLRTLFDYQEHFTMSSLLTSFFLHIYFANADKLRTAGFYLRETLTYAHGLKLHRLESYPKFDSRERQIRLRVFWILFVSERFVGNTVPATLLILLEPMVFKTICRSPCDRLQNCRVTSPLMDTTMRRCRRSLP
jgi:hypothetical protein